MTAIENQIQTNQVSELWDLFRDGDSSAYSELIKKYSKPLFDYGFRFYQDRDFIKDCIQELFLELWQKRDRVSATDFVKYYLFKSLRHKIFRQLTRYGREDYLSDSYSFTVEFSIEQKIINDCNDLELSERIKNILSQLPQRQREILYLRYYEDMSFDRICGIMNINKQSVRNLLQKAYRNFRLEWSIVTVIWVFVISYLFNSQVYIKCIKYFLF